MTKSDIVQHVWEVLDTGVEEAKRAVGATFNAIQKALERGEKVSLDGIGTFRVVDQAARMGRNPKTGAAVAIPARKRVKFKASRDLKLS